MVSICLKSTNTSTLNYIESYLDKTDFPGIYYSQKKFKFFNNIILHYKGKNITKFYMEFSKMLCDYIITNYEKNFVKQELNSDFFYFSPSEKALIQDSISDTLSNFQNIKKKKEILEKCIYSFFSSNSSCNFDGFINFRILPYHNFINSIIENMVNNYIIQKEYIEYVHLLQDYINANPPQTNIIHLIYNDNEKILLDESHNIIANTTNSNKYLSDISFSSNDFILNSLISLLPDQIFIHLLGTKDNFIQFLELIFADKFKICNGCDICLSYLSNRKKLNKQ